MDSLIEPSQLGGLSPDTILISNVNLSLAPGLHASDAAFNGAVDEGALLQASCAKAGIKVDLKKEPADGFWDNVWLKGAFVSSYWGGRAAATQMLSVAFAAKAPWNETHWNNEKFEKLLADARGETDENKRRPYIWEMQAMLNEQGLDHSRLQGLARRAHPKGRRAYAAQRLRHGQRLHYAEGLDQGVAGDATRPASKWPGAAGPGGCALGSAQPRRLRGFPSRRLAGEAGGGVTSTVAMTIAEGVSKSEGGRRGQASCTNWCYNGLAWES